MQLQENTTKNKTRRKYASSRDVEFTCVQCNKTFIAKVDENVTRKYCTHECRNLQLRQTGMIYDKNGTLS